MKDTRALKGGVVAVVLIGLLASSQTAFAVGTIAGTSISNQATVDYKDATGTALPTVTSNVVSTTVAQVYGVDVQTANTPQNTLPNTEVYYPVTVTNTGNGTDDFDLTAVGSPQGWPTTVYLDSNGNGVVDAGEPVVTSTGTMLPDSNKKFIVKVAVPGTATSGQTDTTTVTATSKTDSGATDTAQDVTNVVAGAVITGSKSATPAGVDPLDPDAADRTVTYTVTANNTGQAVANNVVLEDALPTSPAGVKLQAAATTNPAGATIQYYNSGTTSYEAYSAANLALYTRVKATFASVANNASAQLLFKVVVPQFSPPGTMQNFASLAADGLAAVPTNTVDTTIQKTAGVTLSAAAGESTYAGGTVTFNHTATNTGNGSDTFDLEPVTVPAGWSVQMLYADGVTPVADTDGDGKPDTGLLAAGGTFDFVVKVTAPTTATPGAYDTVGQVRSSFDTAITASATDTTTILQDPVVTLTKTVSNTAPVPGQIITYTIGYSVANGPATVTVVQDTIPASTTLVAGSITGGGTFVGGVISWNLGTVPAGTNGSVSFQVQIDANAQAGVKINNTASVTYENPAGTPQTPGTSSAPEATVGAAAGVNLTPDNAGNAVAGATQVYGHVLQNSGNANDTFAVAVSSPNGWPYTVFIDVNGDGILDAGDTQVTAPVAVAAGGSQKLLVRVQVPAGTIVGTVDKAGISATSQTNAAIKSTAFDTTTVVAANAPLIALVKTVSVIQTSYTGPDGRNYNDTVPRPGATLEYSVQYDNRGTGDATAVVIKDAVPANTTLVSGSITGGGTYDAGTNTITWNIGAVAAGGTGTVKFRVKIN